MKQSKIKKLPLNYLKNTPNDFLHSFLLELLHISNRWVCVLTHENLRLSN